jgi:hypothetical protein
MPFKHTRRTRDIQFKYKLNSTELDPMRVTVAGYVRWYVRAGAAIYVSFAYGRTSERDARGSDALHAGDVCA